MSVGIACVLPTAVRIRRWIRDPKSSGLGYRRDDVTPRTKTRTTHESASAVQERDNVALTERMIFISILNDYHTII